MALSDLGQTPCRTCSFLEYDGAGCVAVWKMKAVITGSTGARTSTTSETESVIHEQREEKKSEIDVVCRKNSKVKNGQRALKRARSVSASLSDNVGWASSRPRW
jgi:hypothetical protein